MYERPTGAPESPPLKLDGFRPGFDPFAPSGGYFAPNHFSLRQRVENAALSAFLLAYGMVGLYLDDLYIPGRRSSGIHLHGTAAWLMFGAIVSAVAVLIALLIDHYDRRNNEQHYVRFKKAAALVAWTLFWVASLWHMWAAFSPGWWGRL